MGRARRRRRRGPTDHSCGMVEEAHCIHAKIGRLARFCLSNGCSPIKHLRPYNFKDSGRGLQTLKDIEPGETLIALPKSLLITTSVALQLDELNQAVSRSELKPTPVELMCAFLLSEKRKLTRSGWYEYLDSLPETFTTLLCIHSEDVQLLDAGLAEKYQSMLSKYEEVKNIFARVIGDVSYTEFLWAWHVTNTRCVFMNQPTLSDVRTTPDDLDNFALAPFLDLLNHSPNAMAEYGYNSETGCFQIVTHEGYSKYDQVFIPYSSHSNRALLLEYGFCIPGNEDDCINFSFEEVSKILIPKRADISEKLSAAVLNCGYLCDSNGLSWSLFEAMHIISSSDNIDLTEQKCKELVVSAAADQRLTCLSKLTKQRATHENQRSADELFILDMLVVLYKNEVELLLNAMTMERDESDRDDSNLECVWDCFCSITTD
ncbi:SET domain-containing protein 4-like isoform X2 [Watersipora subatra]|uniref:SET domain-containing protein 4-like isoform X2 n=1 Tax=Watersipora subatra TaxID=2589382 RepID=UPI00355C1086